MKDWSFQPFPDDYETDPEWLAPYKPPTLTDEQKARLKKRAASGSSAKRREYVRPDPSDTEAYAVWAVSTPPSSAARRAEELARWFGAVCQLCLEPIDMTLGTHHPGAKNVDHIIPTSTGGEDVWGNLQLVHRGCNLEKSDLALPEPPPWMYARFCRAAIVRFEEYGLPERSLLERARYDAVDALRHLEIMTTNFEVSRELGLDVSGFRIPQQKKRVQQAIAKVVRIQDRVIAKHDATEN